MKREELTEKWLGNIGGWRALKQARGILGAGAVVECSIENRDDGGFLIKGIVAAGKKQLACGFRVRSTTDVDNLCACFAARRDGIICDHSLAAALGALSGKPKSAVAEKSKEAADAEKKSPSSGGVRSSFELREDFERMWSKGRIQILAKIVADPEAKEDPGASWLAERGVETGGGAGSMPLAVKRGDVFSLWSVLAGLKASFLIGGAGIAIGEMPARLRLVVAEGAEGELTVKGPSLDEDNYLFADEDSAGLWIWQRNAARLLPVELPASERIRRELWPVLAGGETLTRPVEWFIGVSTALEDAFLLESPDNFLRRFSIRPAVLRLRLEVEGSLNAVSACLEFGYGNESGEPVSDFVSAGGKTEIPMMRDPGNPLRFLTRNKRAESAAIQPLLAAGFSAPDDKGWLQLRGEDTILGFYAGLLPALEADSAWEVTRGERFRHVTRNVELVKPVFEPAGSGEDWLEFGLHFESAEGSRIEGADIQRLLQMGRSGIKKPDGRRIALDLSAAEDLQEVLRDTHPEQRGGHFRVDSGQAGYLSESLLRWRGSGESDLEVIEEMEPDFGDLSGLLRDYQEEGSRFLLNHCRRGRGVLLADEMGLGKTLQTLAAVRALRASGEGGPVLVVCPTSLLRNWENEARRWTPNLETMIVHGSKRKEALSRINESDLVFTSYGLLVRDIDHHEEIDYLAIVLDEASAIRNPDTQIAKAACRLRGRGRVALTGTPVENSVRDVWSIFQFTEPGYLGSRDEFRERYELPIARSPEGSVAEQDRLRRRLKPYLLRRTKREVAPELPEKIEQVRLCELTPAQADVYRGLLKKGQEKVNDLLKSQGFQAARMSILSILLRLRQVCCDLRVLEGFDKNADKDSAKLGALGEIFEEAVGGGHRVLVFSQFVGVLGILRKWCEARELEYCYIDGGTPADKRAAEVARFQNGDGPGVFLISLKAGGYGLTLTAADTVIHYDPWWNPAVEQQATDRAHRIGQERTVNVFKLICAGTVEEKILRLQQRKRDVIDAAINDQAPMMAGLNEGDVAEILS